MKQTLFIFAVLALNACTMLTENEKKGVQQIIDLYEGKCDCSRSESHCTLKVSGSRIINMISDLQVPASNCAYIYYSALPPEERQAYTSIIVKVEASGLLNLFKDKNFEKEYSVQDLQHMKRDAQWFDTIVSCIGNKDFEHIINCSHASVFETLDTNTYLGKMKTLGKLCGSVKRSTIMGFTNYKQKVDGKEKELVIISGMIEAEGGKWDITVKADPDAKAGEKRFFGFSWER